jgi:4-hydroxybenzoate polyprenyltransferase
VAALASTCLVCSSNYTINEWLDAPEDRRHPQKRFRPAASGRVKGSLAYGQWLGLAIPSFALAAMVNRYFLVTTVALWGMGIVYNVRPMRFKDMPYGDVLSESVNNPLRFLLGWYATGATAVPPISLILAYWMIGAFFMGAKRLAELRNTGKEAAAGYRRSFIFYGEERLAVSLIFYSTSFAFLGGIFLIRYRLELVLLTPFLSAMMAVYMRLTLQPNSPAQHPEGLYKCRSLMAILVLCVVVFTTCFLIDMPWLHGLFESTLPAGFHH